MKSFSVIQVKASVIRLLPLFRKTRIFADRKKGFGGTDPQELKGARRSYRFTQKLKANAFDGTANQLSAYNSVQLLYNSLPHPKDNLSS